MLKENPNVGFWPKRLPPRPRGCVVLVVEAGVAAAVPSALPKEKPPVLAAGALSKKENSRFSWNDEGKQKD